MNPENRRRVYLWCLLPGALVVGVVLILQFRTERVIAYTYPVLFLYLVLALVALKVRWWDVVTLEHVTFWFLTAFWLASMALWLVFAPTPSEAWRRLSPSVFMGLTILAVMAFLWFDTTVAMVNAAVLPLASSVIGLWYFIPNPGVDDTMLVDFIRYEVYLAITAVFMFALARSKDALLRTRVEAEEMRAMAYRDPLTGLANRRQAVGELERLMDTGRSAGVLLLDLDEFKLVNDEHGHDVGDAVLVRVAEVLRAARTRVAARWGGEEFLLIVDGGLEDAVTTAHHIRDRLAVTEFPDGLTITASVGVVELVAFESVQELLRTVDAEMYGAKRAGRDAIRAAGQQRA